jgi:hypothetical protein
MKNGPPVLQKKTLFIIVPQLTSKVFYQGISERLDDGYGSQSKQKG